MTTNQPSTCAYCAHDIDAHILVAVLEQPVPMGLTLCPDCPCSATWRANTGPSTPEEIAETRQLVRDTLLRDGYPLPDCLQ